MQKHAQHPYYLLFLVCIAALGGFLFGYHTGIISGALIFLVPAFKLTLSQQGMVVSIILIGAMLGSLCAGSLADRIGRKPAMWITALVFVIGSGIIFFAHTYANLLIGRFIAGIGVGTASVVSPLYLSEISPPHLRGRFVSVFQLFLTIGILCAFIVSYLFASVEEWPWMFALGIIPAAIQLFAVPFMQETPQWLFKKGREATALKAITKLYGKHSGIPVSAMKKASTPSDTVNWGGVFRSKYLYVLIIGFVLSMCQQITGINTVIYYAPTIFQAAGFTSDTGALLATVGIGLINAVATIISVWLLDKVGRRALLLVGVGGMVFSLALLSFAFFSQAPWIDKVSLASLMAYVSFFAIGLGPVTFVLLSEIYPLKIRAKAMTIAVFINWFFNYLVSLTFLDFIKELGTGSTFALFAGISFICFFFILRYIPETKRKSLEEIQAELSGK